MNTASMRAATVARRYQPNVRGVTSAATAQVTAPSTIGEDAAGFLGEVERAVRAATVRMSHLAQQDNLTDLPNRILLIEWSSHAAR